jgi:hypothetical protein
VPPNVSAAVNLREPAGPNRARSDQSRPMPRAMVRIARRMAISLRIARRDRTDKREDSMQALGSCRFRSLIFPSLFSRHLMVSLEALTALLPRDTNIQCRMPWHSSIYDQHEECNFDMLSYWGLSASRLNFETGRTRVRIGNLRPRGNIASSNVRYVPLPSNIGVSSADLSPYL